MTTDNEFSLKEVLLAKISEIKEAQSEARKENKDDHDAIRGELKGISSEAKNVNDKTNNAHSKVALLWKLGVLIVVAYSAWLTWLTIQVVEHFKVKS